MSDSAKMMMYDANKKSAGAAYLLWLFLGGIGGHRFYIGRPGSGAVYLVLQLLAWITLASGVGLLLFAVITIFWIFDGFFLAGFVRERNMMLATKLTGGPSL